MLQRDSAESFRLLNRLYTAPFFRASFTCSFIESAKEIKLLRVSPFSFATRSTRARTSGGMLIEIVLTFRTVFTSFISSLKPIAQGCVKDIIRAPVVLRSIGTETSQKCEHVFLLFCHNNTSVYTITKKMINVNIVIDIS